MPVGGPLGRLGRAALCTGRPPADAHRTTLRARDEDRIWRREPPDRLRDDGAGRAERRSAGSPAAGGRPVCVRGPGCGPAPTAGQALAMGWDVWGDWGTTRLRLYRVEGGAVVDRLDGPGIGALSGPPGKTLLQLLKNWNSHG